MNKDDIKKGLENCKRLGGFKGCSKCPYFSTQRCNDTLCEDALNLINEQEKKVERLKDENEHFENNMKAVLEIEKKQAVREFAEKLKEKFYYVFGNEYEQSVSGFDTKVLIEHINETLKEYEK